MRKQALAWRGSATDRKAMVAKLMKQAGFDEQDYELGQTMVFGSAGLEAQFAEKQQSLLAQRELERAAKRERAEALDC